MEGAKQKRSAARRWLVFVSERIPLPVYLLLAGGIAASAYALTDAPFRAGTFASSAAALLVFLGELRLMDELKDHDTDRVAYPMRPLSRGLLTMAEARHGVHVGMAVLVVIAVALGAFVGLRAGAAYAVAVAYLWLIYQDFYGLGARLTARPALHAFVKQLVFVLLCVFAVAVAAPTSIVRAPSFGASILGALFAYEVARNTDPAAPPVLRTYLSVYGPRKTFGLVAFGSVLAAIADWSLGLSAILWPGVGLVIASAAVVLVSRPSRFKLVVRLATLSLLLHLWGPVLHRMQGIVSGMIE